MLSREKFLENAVKFNYDYVKLVLKHINYKGHMKDHPSLSLCWYADGIEKIDDALNDAMLNYNKSLFLLHQWKCDNIEEYSKKYFFMEKQLCHFI